MNEDRSACWVAKDWTIATYHMHILLLRRPPFPQLSIFADLAIPAPSGMAWSGVHALATHKPFQIPNRVQVVVYPIVSRPLVRVGS